MGGTLRRALAVLAVVWACLPTGRALAQDATGTHAFRELGYGDVTARGAYGSAGFFFAVPRGQMPASGSSLDIVFSHSPLLRPDRSTMTAIVNGQSVASVALTPQNRDRAHLTVPLPVDGFVGAGYFVQLQLAMRLTLDECEETQNPALWTTIHEDSRVILPTRRAALAIALADAPALLYPPRRPVAAGTPPGTVPLPDEPTLIVMAARPTAEEIEAAGLVAFQLGQWAASQARDPAVTVARGGVPLADRPAVLVGTGAALGSAAPFDGLSWNGRAFATSGGVVPIEHGVLAVAPTTPGRLLVSGGTPAAVRNAADALAHGDRRTLLTGSYTIVTGARPLATRPRPWQGNATTFAELGVERRELRGPAEHTIELLFERPASWTIRESAALDLAIESSPGLRADTSWLAVSVNGLDMGTRRLAPPGESPRRYRFELPADLLNIDPSGQTRHRLALQIRLFLDLPQLGCTQAAPSSAWAALLPTSAWVLPHETAPTADLSRFPAPFVDESTVQTSVVVPKGPTDDELGAGATAMAALGRWAAAEPSTLPTLISAGSLTESERDRRNLILIGGPARNSASAGFAGLAERLSRPIDPAAYRLAAGERRGELRLFGSPWASERTVLAVTGEGAGGVTLAATALARADSRGGLKGAIVAIVDRMPPQVIDGVGPTPTPVVPLPRVELPPPPPIPPWQVVGAILLGAFLAAVAAIAVVRWGRPRRP